eukprot:TRINITY_DN15756_c0_g3_i1.p1 TRINITY_DN15756_c0_g3~~TRINITY_DN15756_c0_g3_i1.p1  ORF type:complete len:218 (+),score=42.91 TRINITY_DN15756_c0_g3_i1:46-654(+)
MDSHIIFVLWSLNVLEFLILMIAAVFNFPSINAVVPGMTVPSLVWLFMTVDSIVNISVVYLLCSPINAHLKKRQEHILNKSQIVVVRSNHITNVDEATRIKRFQRIVIVAAIGCAVSIFVVVLENIMYFAHQNSPDLNVFTEMFFYLSLLEVIVGLVSQLFNYPRFKKMWKKEKVSDLTKPVDPPSNVFSDTLIHQSEPSLS